MDMQRQSYLKEALRTNIEELDKALYDFLCTPSGEDFDLMLEKLYLTVNALKIQIDWDYKY